MLGSHVIPAFHGGSIGPLVAKPPGRPPRWLEWHGYASPDVLVEAIDVGFVGQCCRPARRRRSGAAVAVPNLECQTFVIHCVAVD